MTRVLYLKGESDSYFAMDIQERYTEKELVAMVEKANAAGEKCDFFDEDDPSYWIGSLELLEFGEVDSDFLDFLYREDLTIDYDLSKHRDFIILD